MLLTWKGIQLARHVPSSIYEVTHTNTRYTRATRHHRLPSSGCVCDSDALQVWDLMQWTDQCYRQSLTFCRTITQSGKHCTLSPVQPNMISRLACGTFVYMPEVRRQQLVQSDAQNLHPFKLHQSSACSHWKLTHSVISAAVSSAITSAIGHCCSQGFD